MPGQPTPPAFGESLPPSIGCRRARVIYAHCRVWLPLESGYLVRMRITFHAPSQRQMYSSDPEPLETKTESASSTLSPLKPRYWPYFMDRKRKLAISTVCRDATEQSRETQEKDDGCLSSLPPLLPLGSVGNRVPVAPPTPASGGLGLQVCATILRLLLNLTLDMVLLHVWSKYKTELAILQVRCLILEIRHATCINVFTTSSFSSRGQS